MVATYEVMPQNSNNRCRWTVATIPADFRCDVDSNDISDGTCNRTINVSATVVEDPLFANDDTIPTTVWNVTANDTLMV
jgi:hypothetical protein